MQTLLQVKYNMHKQKAIQDIVLYKKLKTFIVQEIRGTQGCDFFHPYTDEHQGKTLKTIEALQYPFFPRLYCSWLLARALHASLIYLQSGCTVEMSFYAGRPNL